jgi:hypothetical protein
VSEEHFRRHIPVGTAVDPGGMTTDATKSLSRKKWCGAKKIGLRRLICCIAHKHNLHDARQFASQTKKPEE